VKDLISMLRPVRVGIDAVIELFFCACIILPSGSIAGLNVKQILFVATLLAVSSRPYRYKLTKVTVTNAIFFTGLLFAWVPLAYLTGRSDGILPLLHFKDIAVTTATALLVSLYISDENRRARFIRLVLYCVGITSAIKVISFAYAAATGTSVVDIIHVINDVFDQNLVTLDDGGVGARFQFVSDSLLPVAFYALLAHKGRFGITAKTSVLLTILFVFSTVVSFSRFLWLYSAIAIVLGMITTRLDRLKLVYLLLVGITAAYFWDVLTVLYEWRTSDDTVEFSDGLREEQRGALYKFVMDAPIFGHGLGTYTAEVIREPVSMYAYELQLVALVGQIGAVGTAILGLLVVYYYRGVFDLRRSVLQSGSAAILIAIWIASGFQNPWLASSSAGITFGLLYSLVPCFGGSRQSERSAPRSDGTSPSRRRVSSDRVPSGG
jgi:hypothetical protein